MSIPSAKTADQVIRNHSWFSAVPGFFPIPVLDVAAITAVQLDMVKQLCKIYNINYSEQKGKSLITALIISAMGRIPGYAVNSFAKTIPVIGWVAGGISLAFFARASTYATGMVFKSHFEEGGTLNDMNPESFKKFYAEQYKEAKDVLKQYFEKAEEKDS